MTEFLEGQQLAEELRGRDALTGSIKLRERKSNSRSVLDEFQIKGVIHAGSSCICYSAVRFYDDGTMAESGTLKEFYPVDSGLLSDCAYNLKRRPADAGQTAKQLYSEKSTLTNFISAKNEFRSSYQKISSLKFDKKKYDCLFAPIRIYRGIADRENADNYTLYIWHPGDSALKSFSDYLDEAFADINNEIAAPKCDLNLFLANELYTVLRAVRLLAAGIHNLHMENFLHLDIKPANFGIRMQEKGRQTEMSVSLFDINTIYPRTYKGIRTAGTLYFRAPEMVGDTYNNAKKIKVGCQSDVFSLGATLYNALIVNKDGRGLYDVSDFAEIDAALSNSLLIKYSDYNSKAEIVDILLRILKRSLARNVRDYKAVEDNYLSAGGFLKDITDAEELVAQEIYNAKKAGSRNKAVVSIINKDDYYASHTQGGAAGVMQRLLYDVPLYEHADENGNMNVLVLGSGVFGQKFTDTAFQLAQLDGCRLNITVASKEKENDQARYLNARPEFRKYFSVNGERPQWADYGIYGSVSFVQTSSVHGDGFTLGSGKNIELLKASLGEIKQKYSYVFISLCDDQLNRQLAMELACSDLLADNGNAVISYITYATEEKEKARLAAENDAVMRLEGIKIKPVSVEDTLLNHKDYPLLLEMAFNCHLLWHGTLNADLNMLYKEFSSPYTFLGSLANALSLKYKLHSLGLRLNDVTDEKNKKQRSEKLRALTMKYRELVGAGVSPSEKTAAQQKCVDILTEYEHRRWNVSLITELSYEILPEKEFGSLFSANKDDKNRKHTCLVPSRIGSGLLSDFWNKDLSVWDSEDLLSSEQLAELDPLDRVSVMLHRQFASVASEINTQTAETDASVIRKHIRRYPAAAASFNAYMISLRNLKKIVKRSLAGDFVDRATAENLLRCSQKSRENLTTALRSAGIYGGDLRERLSAIDYAFAPAKKAAAYTIYKSNDLTLIDGIPFMLNYSKGVRLCIPFVSGNAGNAWFENTASSLAVNPAVVTYLVQAEPTDESIERIRDIIANISGVMDSHNLQTRLSLLVFMNAPKGVSAHKKAEAENILRNASSRVDGADILEYSDEAELKQRLSGTFETNLGSVAEFTAVELNSSELSRLIEKSISIAVPSYRFDTVKQTFTAEGEDGYIWLADIPFEVQLSVEDMFLSQGRTGVYQEAELHNDYKDIWESCYFEKAGDGSKTEAWNALCRAVKKKTSSENLLLEISLDGSTDAEGTVFAEKSFFLPAFCRESAEKIFGFLSSEPVNAVSSLSISDHNLTMLKITFSASASAAGAICALLANPYMLADASSIYLVCDECRAAVYFDSLVVNGFDWDELASQYASEAKKAFGYLAEKGYISVFNADGRTADFCFAAPEIKELMTDECRLPELYVYYQLLDSGCFDEIRNGLVVQTDADERLYGKPTGFDIVTVKGLKTQIIKVTSAQIIDEECYQELRRSSDMFGVNCQLILISASGGAECVPDEKYGIITISSPEDIECIGTVLCRLMQDERRARYE